jgi:hypothetical protein
MIQFGAFFLYINPWYAHDIIWCAHLFLYGKLNVSFYIEKIKGCENDVIMMCKFKENIKLHIQQPNYHQGKGCRVEKK